MKRNRKKIGKVAAGVIAQDSEEFARNLHAHENSGHTRQTELATVLK